MARRRVLATTRAAALTAAVVVLVCVRPASAKDTAGLWYIGLGPGFYSTQDSVRSNAALENDVAAFNDPRPDRFEDREMSIQDGLSYWLTAGFGITKHLSLQLDAGYFKGSVGPVDVFLTDTFPVINPYNSTNVIGFHDRQITIPVSAGVITEIPVSLSGIVRFRKDRSFNPYIGAGFGKIFTQVDASDDVGRLNDRLSALRIQAEFDEFHNELTPARYQDRRAQGKVPLTYPVTVHVADAMEWHLTAGLEYFLNTRFSVAAEARYMSTGSSIVIEMEGEDQVNFQIFSEKLFRKDGSLKFFNDSGKFPNPLVDPNDPTKGTVDCVPNVRADFDLDGRADDLCYKLERDTPDPVGTLVVQGGKINLSGLTVNVFMRVWF